MPVILLDAVVIFQDPVPPVPPEAVGPVLQVPGRGLRIVFNEELFYPGTGASPPTGKFAGTHSGVYTNLWSELSSHEFGIAFAGGELIQNEATYDLKALPAAGGQPALKAGQITVHGVVPIDKVNFSPFAGGATPTIAITGGTGPYQTARGQVTYAQGQPHRLQYTV
jgi:hypothetical protein